MTRLPGASDRALAWGLLRPPTAADLAMAETLPPGAFGDLIRHNYDPLWRLAADLPELAERLARECVPRTVEERAGDEPAFLTQLRNRVSCYHAAPTSAPVEAFAHRFNLRISR